MKSPNIRTALLRNAREVCLARSTHGCLGTFPASSITPKGNGSLQLVLKLAIKHGTLAGAFSAQHGICACRLHMHGCVELSVQANGSSVYFHSQVHRESLLAVWVVKSPDKVGDVHSQHIINLLDHAF